MYIRNRQKELDDPTLLSICIENFDVPETTIKSILKYAHEVLIICHDNGEIAGFLSYRLRINHMVLIDYVVLDRSVQRKGIARALLPVFQKYLLDKGITTIFGMVDKENSQGIKSFKRLGFETKGCFLTNYIIEKKLSNNLTIESESPHIESLKTYVRKLSSTPTLRKK